jgi:RIO1 family
LRKAAERLLLIQGVLPGMGIAPLLRPRQLGLAAEVQPRRSLVNPDPGPQVRELCNPGAVYQKLMEFMERLARLGLIHCDFNEFNVMVGAAVCRKRLKH